MSSEQDIKDDLQQIYKTNSILNNLEVKLNQYMSKSRIITQRAPTAMTFVMPNIDFKTTNRSMQISERKQDHNRQNSIINKSQNRQDSYRYEPTQSVIKNYNIVDQQIRLYKNKIGITGQYSTDRFEQLYQNKARRLDEQIEQLTQRKLKIQNDKQILGKQNRRLTEILKQKQKDYRNHCQKQRKQLEKVENQKKYHIDQKRKKLLAQIQKQKLLGEQLDSERRHLEQSIRIINERPIILADYDSRQTSQLKSKSKTKSISQRKAKSSTSKNYPASTTNRHKNCTIQVSKSKALLKKKFY